MPGADDCAIAARQGMLDVLKLDTLPPEWEPMAKERVVQAIAEDPELAHDIMYAGPDVTKHRYARSGAVQRETNWGRCAGTCKLTTKRVVRTKTD